VGHGDHPHTAVQERGLADVVLVLDVAVDQGRGAGHQPLQRPVRLQREEYGDPLQEGCGGDGGVRRRSYLMTKVLKVNQIIQFCSLLSGITQFQSSWNSINK